MKLNFLRFALSALLVIGITAGAWAQTTLASHDGNTTTGASNGWTQTNIAASTTYMQLIASNAVLISPVMNVSSYSTKTLTFKARTFGGPSTTERVITISISTDNGGNWTPVTTKSPSNTTLTDQGAIDLSSYTGTQVLVRFQTLAAAGGRGAGIDDILITGVAGSSCGAPTVTASAATSVTTAAATLNGNVTSVGSGTASAIPARRFEYGTSSTLASPTTITASGTGTGAFSANISSLSANTRYYYRAKAVNDCPDSSYSTTSSHPSFYTIPAQVTANAGTSPTTVGFTANWTDVSGTIETYEVEVSTSISFASPVESLTGLTGTSTTLNTLSQGTDYYYRVRANNAGGVAGAWSSTIGPVTTVDNSIPISAVNTNFIEAFSSYTGLSAATIPTGWVSSSTTFQGNGTTTSTGGGNYTFSTPSDGNNFGALRTGTTGNIALSGTYRNTTGVTINTLEISYDFIQWKFGNLSGFTVTQTGLGSSDVSSLSQAGVTSGSTSSKINKTLTLTGLSIPNNATFTLTWTANDATNADNGLSIDNVTVKANPVAAPNITVTGNSTLIADADVIPSTTDHTQFVNTVVGSSNTRTFTINNTGTSTLNLTGTPRVSISGSSEFAVTTQPSAASIAGGGSLTFVVTFTPTSTGSKTATLTILSDDPDAADATYTFGIAGSGTGNAASDIIAGTFTAPANIAYFNYTSNNITAGNSVEVGKFTIRDGAGGADADGDATTLTDITFSLTNSANIQRVAIYDGTTEIQEVAGGATVAFSGLTLSAADGSTKDFSLRVTYSTTVTDNQNYQFTVTAATALASGSTFAAANAGGATTSVTGNNNRIIVTADRLVYTTQPASGSVNVALAAFDIAAVDVNNNVDLNATNSITLTTIVTGATISNPYTLTAGEVSVTNVQYNAVQTNITITATTTGLAVSNTVTSSAFNISTITFVNGDYRTTGSGTWVASSASPAIWQRYNGSTWATSNSPAYNTSNNVYVYNSLTSGGSFGSSVNLKIMSGGDFTVAHQSTTGSIYVYDGGSLYVENALTNSGSFDVEDNADVVLAHLYTGAGGLATNVPLWNGTENFRPNSNLFVWKWDEDYPLLNGAVTPQTYNGYTAAFGNVYIDLSVGAYVMGGNWNMTGTSLGNTNIAHGDLDFAGTAGTDIRINGGSGTYTSGIGGNLSLSSGWGSARTMAISTATSTFTFNVKGNVTINGAGALSVKQSPGGLTTLNVDGDINVNNSGSFLLSGQYTTSSVGMRGVVNLMGNLSVSATGNLGNSMFSDDVAFNFIANATPHTVSVANTVGNNPNSTDQGFPFFVKNGATVRLLNNDLVLDYGSKVTVETGGVFDFNWTAANVPLLVTQLATPSGSNINAFITQQGSRLYITSPDGITTSGAAGNVRTSTRTYNQVAYFNYVGKTNQVTGNGLTGTGNGKVVTVTLASNSVTLTPSNDIGISNGTTIEAQGGRLEIQKGIVIGSAAAEFKGSGRLVMTDGTYQMSETGLTLPQLTNYGAYLLSGGTVELNGIGAQDLSASPSSYYNVKFSGTNTGGTDVVTTNGGLVIDNNLNITNSAIFDSENHGVTGNAGVTMNSGRWRIGKVAAVLPELTATAAGQSYSLTGGTVEYYNAGAAQSQTIRAADGNSNMITYYKVEVNAAAANTATGNLRLNTNETVGVSNSFTVFAGASALLNMNSTIVGTGTFEVKPDATLLYGHTAGITTGGATGNVQVSGTRTYQNTASYGFIGGAATMFSGSGLPATFKNLYVNKTSGTHTVTLTNSVSITGDLELYNGLLVLGGKDITLSNTSTVTGTPSATAMVVTNSTGKFFKGYAAGASSFTYPVGDNTGTVEYSPATINFSANTAPGTVGLLVTDAVHPNMGTSSNYASRYWTLSSAGLTNYTYTGSYTYAAADVVGNQALYKASRWAGSAWNAIAGSSAAANTVTITTAQTQTSSPLSGDYTARLASTASVYTWTGDVNTEWDIAGNWDVNMVPDDCTHNVVVPSNPPSGNYPAIDVIVSVGNIQVGDNSRITLDANLNVCGNWTGAPSVAAVMLGNGSVVLQGSTTQTLSGRTQFNTLRVNNNAQVQSGAALEVFTALELESGTFAAGNNLLTFRSISTTEVAILDNFSSGFTGTLTGSIKAERYYASPAAQSFGQHFMGSPVDAPTFGQFGASGVAGQIQPLNCWIDSFATGSPYGSVYEYIEANGATCGMQVWTARTSGNTVNGKGYSVYRNGTGTLTVSGTPNLGTSYSVSGLGNSNYSNNASYIQTPPLTSVTINSGWHMVANPYLATLNVTTHAANSGFQAQIQVWEASGPFAGTYRPRMTNSNAAIAPFQAFMVRNANVGSSATYNLYATDRSTASTTFYRQANQSELKITAQNTTTGLLDETFVAFNTDATAQFDDNYDANKMQGSNTRHSLYTVLGSDDYSINTLNDVTQTSTVPMSMRPGGDATFKFTVDGINTFDATQYIYLEDKITGQMIDLRQNPEYTFSMTTAEAFDRFVLHFTPAAAFAATNASCDAQGQINITQPGTANWNYTVTDANSATISSGTLNQANPVTVNAATGVYTVTLVDANNYTVARNVQVNGANAADATFTPSATTVEEGTDVTLVANQTGNNTYAWDLGNGTTATGSGVTLAYNTPGVYTVELTVTNAGGCTATSTQIITVNAKVETGIKDVTDDNIKLWSNKNKVYVDFGKTKLDNATVAIYNLIGQELSKEKFNGTIYIKEVTQLEAGYILVRVENNGNITTKKLLITNK